LVDPLLKARIRATIPCQPYAEIVHTDRLAYSRPISTITMSEFKFNCPSCGQHLTAETSMSGSGIDCPTCQSSIVVPAPEEASKAPQPAPAKAPATPPAPAAAARFPTRPLPTPASSQAQTVQISNLTPEVKLDIVRSVRRRVADESHWLPRKTEAGEFAYAAKIVDGKNVAVEVTSPEASRFSVLGAMLLEFHERNVTQMASGRRELLDSDVLDALNHVLEKEKGGPVTDEDLRAITVSHAQSIAMLDYLEKRYDRDKHQTRAAEATQKLDSIRMEDVVKKLESKAPLSPEDVATAVFFELEDIKRRLTELERATAKKP
jgi:DNA-directed RNA polymerase subunit RPC12/RpoP